MSEQQNLQALPAGYEVHWYRIESVIGHGGFGITYLAHDGNLNRQVAVKEYLPSDLSMRTRDSTVQPVDETQTHTYRWGLDRFLSEARTLARFHHPNIVRVHSVFEANNTAYMVMDYEAGQSLTKFYRKPENRREEALMRILLPLLDGLEQVHAAGFIHRDIKPSNIFVRGDGSPVVLDFGSARQALGVETHTLTSLVSPGYAPFEQYNATRDGDRQGPWTDIYALGATLYRAVAGKGPVDALTRAGAILRGHKDLLEPASSAANGSYSTPFLTAIDRALAFQAEARPQSIAAWRRMFHGAVGAEGLRARGKEETDRTELFDPTLGAAEGEGGSGEAEKTMLLGSRADEGAEAVGEKPAEPPRPGAGGRRAGLATTGLGIAILAAAAAWWLARGSGEPSPAALAQALESAGCAAVEAAVDDRTATIRGYATGTSDLDAARASLAAVPGVESVQSEVRRVDDSHCALLELYAPYWRANRTGRLGLALETSASDGELQEGEALVVRITAPLYDSYLYVDFHAHGGSVVHMAPTPESAPLRVAAGETVTIGEDGAWIVSAPFGTEMISVLSSRQPLFDAPRDELEEEAEYLRAVAAALADARVEAGRRQTSADLLLITTKPKP